jgi:hypothetical protein
MIQRLAKTLTKHATQLAVIAIASLLLCGGCAPKAQPVQAKKQGYTFWPPAPDEPHIQFLTTINSSKDLKPAATGGLEKMIYGNEPEDVLAIQKPYAVRFWNGRLYVCETRQPAITVLDLAQQQTRIMGSSGAGAIKHAVDLAIAPDGTKYVVDQQDSAIKVYNPAERYVTTYPIADAQLNGACVFGPYLYVTDFKNSRVLILDRNYGKILKTFGQRGGQDGEFIGPVGIAADKRGCVYVTDVMLARVQKFGPDGTFMMKFGTHGQNPGTFMRPKHLGIGSDGRIHVVDSLFGVVQVFDAEGRFEGFYGSPGKHAGSMDQPAGLELIEPASDLFARFVHPAFEVERAVVVSNQFGARKLNLYAMGHLKEGKTIADLRGREAIETGLTAATQPTTLPAAAAAPQAPATRPGGEFKARP